MIKIESPNDWPDYAKAQYASLPPDEKYKVTMQPWGMGAFAYRFADEEIDAIEEILSNGRQKVPDEKMVMFVMNLEGIASQKKYEMLDTPKKVIVRANRQDIINDGKTFLKHLESIVTCSVEWVTYDDLEPGNEYIEDDDEAFDGRFGDPVTHIKAKVWSLADKIREPLQEMLKSLETFQDGENKKIGRYPADADNFTKLIAEAYSKHIGKPSAYPDGQFYSIVQYILDVLGIKGKGDLKIDPTRAIRQALNKMEK